MITTIELAQRVGLHPETIRGMVQRGELIPDLTIGGRRGHQFEEEAVWQVREILQKRAKLRLEKIRRTWRLRKAST